MSLSEAVANGGFGITFTIRIKYQPPFDPLVSPGSLTLQPVAGDQPHNFASSVDESTYPIRHVTQKNKTSGTW